MHIGLIVGIGPAATDYYYRYLISALARAGQDLALTMAHADTRTLRADTEAAVALVHSYAGTRPGADPRSRAMPTSAGGEAAFHFPGAFVPAPDECDAGVGFSIPSGRCVSSHSTVLGSLLIDHCPAQRSEGEPYRQHR